MIFQDPAPSALRRCLGCLNTLQYQVFSHNLTTENSVYCDVYISLTIQTVTELVTRKGSFYGDLLSPATVKPIWVLMYSVRFCPDFKQIWNQRQIFIQNPYMKCHTNPSSGSRFDKHRQMDKLTNGRTNKQSDTT